MKSKSNKLQAKDLINVGIFTAIYFVIFFAGMMLGYIPIFIPLLGVRRDGVGAEGGHQAEHNDFSQLEHAVFQAVGNADLENLLHQIFPELVL